MEDLLTNETLIIIITVVFVFTFITILVNIISLWKIFKKAGLKGWEAIIPLYNFVMLVQITESPSIVYALFFIPGINFIGIPIAHWMVTSNLAKRFNKDIGFVIGLIFLPIVFYPLLAFGDAVYERGEANPSSPKPEGPVYPSINSESQQPVQSPVNVKPQEPVQSPVNVKPQESISSSTNVISQGAVSSSVGVKTKTVNQRRPSYKICSNCGTKCSGTSESCFLCGTKL